MAEVAVDIQPGTNAEHPSRVVLFGKKPTATQRGVTKNGTPRGDDRLRFYHVFRNGEPIEEINEILDAEIAEFIDYHPELLD